MQELQKFYAPDGPERCGLILTDGTVLETANVANSPDEAFEIPDRDLVKYEEQLAASWHTHPGVSSQLSYKDFEGFLSWPNLRHYIIGSDGITAYVVRRGAVVIDE